MIVIKMRASARIFLRICSGGGGRRSLIISTLACLMKIGRALTKLQPKPYFSLSWPTAIIGLAERPPFVSSPALMTYPFNRRFGAEKPLSAGRGRLLHVRADLRVLVSTVFALGLLFALTAATYADDHTLKMEEKNYAGTELGVVRLNHPSLKLNLYWLKPDGSPYSRLDDLRQALVHEGRVFLMATNSGIYSRDFKPLGLHVENGKVLRPINRSRASGGNFSLIPNGIFLVTKSGARVVETSEYQQIKEPVIYATQSGPLLVHNGQLNPSFSMGSQNRKLRSGVGVDRKGVVIFAISKGPINFFDFANFFSLQLDCPNALYLDGTISQILMNSDEASDLPVSFVGMWAVTADPN
jgi:uncharacterized protein YigE (DUF2233 family)